MAGPGEFDLLPPDPGLINPDLELEAALAPVVTLGPQPLAPLGKGWAFDFLARRFVRRGSAPAEVFEIDNLRMWIEKTLRTARYAHPIYCVDDSTEILTRNGWCSHSELEVDTEVLTLNHETGESEWQPALRVNRFAVENEEMLAIEGRGHSSLTTLAHRWPVIERCGADRRIERRWRTSDALTSEVRIVTAAPCADVPTERSVSDELVEAVAWFWTEGYVQVGRSSQITIVQSVTANPGYVADIRRALTTLYGPAVQRRMSSGAGALKEPMWREYQSSRGLSMFNLNTRASTALLDVAPRKIVCSEFLLRLTRHQLELFIDISLRADGWRSRTGTDLIAQKDPQRLAAMELALILVGRTPRVYLDKWVCRTRRERYSMTTLSASRKTTFGIPNRARMDRCGSGAQATQCVYTGIVWCPTTPNHTWLARRNGCVYFTGNTDSYGMVEPDQVIGNPYSSRMLASYRKAVVDALLVHDRIASVDDFVFESGPLDDALYVTFTVTLDSEAQEMFTVSSLPLAPTLR